MNRYIIKKLSEIAKLIMWQSPTSDTYNSERKWLPFYQWKKDFWEIYPTPEVWCNEPIKVVEKWDILISVRAPVWPTNLCNETSCIGRWLAWIRPKLEILELSYLRYYFKKYETEISKLWKWSTFVSITKSDLENLEIPLPPLSTQASIVERLDSAMVEIDEARRQTESALASAREVWESTLESVFASGGEGWEDTKLQYHIELILWFAFKSKGYSESEEDILLLRGDNIMQGYIRHEDIKRWKKSEYDEYIKYQLREDDILLAMDRPWTKAWLKCAKLEKEYLPALLVQRTACLRNKKTINNSFLYYIVKSKKFMNHLLSVQTGSGVPHISWQQILDFCFHISPFPEQSRIVAHLDAVRAETESLEKLYTEKLASLDELRRSVLAEAFS